jgi:hypothetical protein
MTIVAASTQLRLAFILRPIPPALIERMDEADLRGLYYARLWSGWSERERAASLLLSCKNAVGALTARRRFGRRALDAWRLGFAPGMLAEIDARIRPDARLGAFLDQDERKGLHALINRGALPFDANPLKNKRRFEAFCRGAGLPVAATLAEDLPEGIDGLIVKPQYGSKGKGVRRFERGDDGAWVATDGSERMEPSALPQWVARQGAAGFLVQERLRTEPALLPLSPGALPTLRVTTCLDERGVPEVADVALRLSMAADRAADNFNADNLVCAVAAHGELGPALRRVAGGFEELAAHPTTRAPIAGERLAAIEAARTLAITAHEPLADGFTVIGWDIGLTDKGPVLIEGNWNPGYNVMQLVHGRGIGEMRLGELYRFHLERLPDAAWAAAGPIQVAQRPCGR